MSKNVISNGPIFFRRVARYTRARTANPRTAQLRALAKMPPWTPPCFPTPNDQSSAVRGGRKVGPACRPVTHQRQGGYWKQNPPNPHPTKNIFPYRIRGCRNRRYLAKEGSPDDETTTAGLAVRTNGGVDRVSGRSAEIDFSTKSEVAISTKGPPKQANLSKFQHPAAIPGAPRTAAATADSQIRNKPSTHAQVSRSGLKSRVRGR